MAHVTLHGAEVAPRFQQRRGRGMPQGRGADVALADTGALFGCAKSALDAAAGQRGGGAGQGCVIASGSGPEPGGVAVRFPGGASQVEGVIGQGDGAVLRALATMHMPHVARAVDGTHLKGERCVEAQSTAGEGGAGGAMVQGRQGLEEAWARCAAENGREAWFGLSSHALQGFPGASQDLLVEETESALTDAHGAWRETIAVFSMPKRGWQVLGGDAVGGFVGELSQQADLAARGLLSTFALATELQSGAHVLAQWGHDRPPLLS
jgi:hypothetical protein